MKRSLCILALAGIVLVLLAGCASAAVPAATEIPTSVPPTAVPPTATPPPASPTPSAADAVTKLHWFGTSSFLYNGSKVIYFDPVTLDGNLPKADLILVTHAHSDHWSVPDLQKIISPTTKLIIGGNVSTVYQQDKDTLGIPAIVLPSDHVVEFDGVKITTVPAYDTTFHPKSSGGVGFLVTVDGLTFYMTGGTDAYPEMANYACDIAFVPVYSKNQAQAIVDILPAKVVVFDHTSYYAAKAVGDVFSQNANGKTFVALEAGPFNP